MDKYLISKKTPQYKFMLWISSFLLIFNVYHTKLMSIVISPLLASSATTLVIQGFAVAMLVSYFITVRRMDLLKTEIQPVEWLLILTLVIILVTTEEPAENITYITRYAVLVLIVMLMKYDENLPHIIFCCILMAGVVHLAATLWFYFDTDFYMGNIWPHFDSSQKAHLYEQVMTNNHGVGLSNHYSQNGIYMAITLCASFALFFVRPQKNRVLKGIFFGIVMFALFLTGKRGVLIFAVFAVLAAYMLSTGGAFSNKLISILFMFSSVLFIMYALSFYVDGLSAAFERLSSMLEVNENDDISNGRFKLYGIAWDFFSQSPVFGIGWREFSKEVVNFYNQDSVLRDAHNVFLQLLCETGITGFVIFMALFIASAFMTAGLTLKNVKGELRLSEQTRGVLIFSLCYQIFFLAYCITGNPLYDLETVYVYIFSIGFSSAIYFKNREELEKIKIRSAEKSKYIR